MCTCESGFCGYIPFLHQTAHILESEYACFPHGNMPKNMFVVFCLYPPAPLVSANTFNELPLHSWQMALSLQNTDTHTNTLRAMTGPIQGWGRGHLEAW